MSSYKRSLSYEDRVSHRFRKGLAYLLSQRSVQQSNDRIEMQIASGRRKAFLHAALMRNRVGPLGLRRLNKKLSWY